MKRDILLAINCMDLLLINFKNNRLANETAFDSVEEVIKAKVFRPVYTDLIQTCGKLQVNAVEEKFKDFLTKIYSNCKFNFRSKN